MDFKKIFYLLLCIGLLLRLFTVFFVPVFYAADEEPHFRYIFHLATENNLPKAYSVTSAPTNDWEFHQPPLYYILCSALISKNFLISFFLCRIFSVVLFSGTFIMCSKILGRFNCNLEFTALFLTFVALLPTYIFVSSSINNDNLIIFLSTLIIYLVATLDFKSWKNLIFVSMWLALGFYTKLTAVIPAIFIGAFFMFKFLANKEIIWLNKLVVLFVSTLVFLSPFFLRNMDIYGNFIGWVDVHQKNLMEGSLISKFLNSLDYMSWSFYSIAGIVNELRPYNWIFGYVLMSLINFGAIKSLKNKNSFVHASLIAFIANITFIVWFGVEHGQAQGRFLLMSLPFAAFYFSLSLICIKKHLKKIRFKSLALVLCIFLASGYFLNILKLNQWKNSGRLQKYTTDFRDFEQKKSPAKPEK